MEWKNAPDIHQRIKGIIKTLEMSYLHADRIICFRSHGSTSRARARIWSLPRVWQQALKIQAHYIVEVLDRHFDKLSVDDQNKVLIHELLHIPKNFSGSLVPHRTRYGRLNDKVVQLFKLFKKDVHDYSHSW